MKSKNTDRKRPADFNEKIDLYLQGRLGAAESDRLIRQLKSDPDLQEQAAFIANLDTAIHNVEREKERENEQVLVDTISEMSEEEFRELIGYRERKVSPELADAVRHSGKIHLQASSAFILDDKGPKVAARMSHHTPSSDMENDSAEKTGRPALRTPYRVLGYCAAACLVALLAFGGLRYNLYTQTVALGNDMANYSLYTQTLDLKSAGESRSAVNYTQALDLKSIGEPRSPVNESETKAADELRHLFANVQNGTELKATIERLETLYGESKNELSTLYPYQDDIAWNLAIAYLKEGSRKRPEAILEEMAERNKVYPEVSAPVLDLLEKIRSL